jgi:predicted Zn-dependent protease
MRRPPVQSVFTWALFALLALLSTGCGTLISNTKEVEIGRGVDAEIEKQYRMVEANDALTKWARDLVSVLSTASKQFRDPVEFEGYKVEVIADDTVVNAFAAPGGYTYITTGLILQAKTCGEITGVLGHELGHVTQRHGVKSLEAAMAGEELSRLVLGEGLASDAAQTIWAFLNSTQFSQEHEEEADEVGVQIAHDAGYNPFGLVDFFRKIQAMEKAAGGSGPQFLSSHPATKDRIGAVTKQITAAYGTAVVAGKTQTYECRGTDLSLAQVQDRIRKKDYGVRAGTGTSSAPPSQ